MYLLDTNVVSELRVGKANPDLRVRAWAAGVPGTQQYLSSIVLMELEMGVLRKERTDKIQGAMLRQWLDGVQTAFGGRILDFGGKSAFICARLHVPDNKSWRDSMIAATAIEHGFTVVTRNEPDFKDTDAKTLNPWL